MLSADTSLYVHDTGRTVYRNDSAGQTRGRHSSKAFTRTRRKNALREHPFLPKEITDRVISFAGSFGLRVVLVAKIGKLIYSRGPVSNMTAHCCIFYVDTEGLKVGLAVYRKGKVSLFDDNCFNNNKTRLSFFRTEYEKLARDIQYAVLSNAIKPAVVPGLFLKSNNVKCC